MAVITSHPSVEPAPCRVLLVDDDPLVRRAMARMLKRHYEVVCLESADRALVELEERCDFQAVICDLRMPGMSGAQFWEALGQRWPELRGRLMFFSGGHLADLQAEVGHTGCPVLVKPVLMGELMHTVDELARRPGVNVGVA